ncbi:hypothetical protein O9433_15530 [Proteus mirabilis]|uniref:Uncharacterized protein n=2 Tax=Enterobacterales TaxID=91347 RepID=A0A2Z5DT23_PROMI|nr:hypothetical protein [Proteus mirabilis]MDM3714689.1 hypothetical protein [Proteus mirabilis]HBC5066106.1 hypothetical protein [Proteus mirabilis]HBC5068217.1 hypothetical protein [Proteus mirabilis]
MSDRGLDKGGGMQDIFEYAAADLGLSRMDFAELKAGLAGLGFPGGERHYQALPEHLKEHEIGLLMRQYIETGNTDLIEQAAKKLFNYHPKWSLWLMH